MAEAVAVEAREALGDECVYECGYLISPLVPEGDLTALAAEIRTHLERAGATVIAEGLPQTRTLAYPVQAHTPGGEQLFSQAAFGWIRYELPRSAAQAFEDFVRGERRLIRVLTMQSVRELTHAPRPHFARGEQRAPHVEKHQELTEADEREIEKGIEELLTTEKPS